MKSALVNEAKTATKFPRNEVLARSSVVEARLETNRSVAVAFCKVLDAVAKKLPV